MNRTEALEALRAILAAMEDTYHKFLPAQIDKMQAAIAALSAPCDICGGRKPLVTIVGGITDEDLYHAQRGPSNPFDEVTIACRGRANHRPVDVLILPADEPQEEAP